MTVIFMGTPDYASSILKSLINDHNINVAAVYTQPDKPVGRKKIMTPPPVKVLAQENGIEIYQPSRLRDEEVVSELLTIACDYIVVAAYGQILPKAILDYVPCINLHASILPQYRGASPIQQSLLNGDKESGVTAMLMDVGLDTGDILKIERITIDKDEMLETLFNRLTDVASDLTLDVLKNFNTLSAIAQDNDKATHCTKITKADGQVRFDNATALYNRYRAFTPWPGVYLESGLKLKKIAFENAIVNNSSGKILSVDTDSIVVSTLEGSLRIFTVQPPSKKEMRVIDYLNGARLNCDDTLA
ncbi:MAG: methionyl-tRNA formyltransferase [Campylobacterota bacterium]|nr:methionyl-tRNA formyltransferase [Campylobacterota bacterium]